MTEDIKTGLLLAMADVVRQLAMRNGMSHAACEIEELRMALREQPTRST